MKNILLIISFLIVPGMASAQNYGIGTIDVSRAKLVIHGVSAGGSTTAIFGGDLGISLQRNNPAIGFNQYRDDSLPGNNGRYLGNGYAAVISFPYNEPNTGKGLAIDLYPPGLSNALLPAGIR